MKHYIDVYVYFDTLGNMVPAAIWFKGKEYQIDKVIDVRRAASEIGGGAGVRYTCRVMDKDRYIFFDEYEKKWFVEYK